jgi:hypothetical protein
MKSLPSIVSRRLFAEIDSLLSKSIPYRFGGNDPSQGFDCNGLVTWLLNAAGIKITGHTAQTYYTYMSQEEPDKSWGEYLSSTLALAFPASASHESCNHVAFRKMPYGTNDNVIVQSSTLYDCGLDVHEDLIKFLDLFTKHANGYDTLTDNRVLGPEGASALITYLQDYLYPFDNAALSYNWWGTHTPLYMNEQVEYSPYETSVRVTNWQSQWGGYEYTARFAKWVKRVDWAIKTIHMLLCLNSNSTMDIWFANASKYVRGDIPLSEFYSLWMADVLNNPMFLDFTLWKTQLDTIGGVVWTDISTAFLQSTLMNLLNIGNHSNSGVGSETVNGWQIRYLKYNPDFSSSKHCAFHPWVMSLAEITSPTKSSFR